eukprot:TRINITY_DN24134_c0_g1_i1.p1 TRINITY_DN24134_c0_g1~~TRINITY_DN24134_c0_g1_i1.p1  ORF type:complete len:344 (+),score=48.57 TRINITY_DN24134_c0_g1_i1:36-1034(+)
MEEKESQTFVNDDISKPKPVVVGEDTGPHPIPNNLPPLITLIRALAIVSMMLIPLTICVNIFFSYRLDPVGYFQCYSNYSYALSIDCTLADTVYARTACRSYSSAFWTHKITTAIWTCVIILHVCLITVWGKLNWGVHELLGFSVLLCANLAATSGLIMVQADLLRYDTFTKFFVITAAVVVYLLTLLWLLSVVFKPRCWAYDCHHSNFGFLYLFPPLAMVIQFIIYSIGLAFKGVTSGGCHEESLHNDYTLWRTSLWVCGAVALVMSVLFYTSYFKLTKPYLIKANYKQEEVENVCGNCYLATRSLKLFGNLRDDTPVTVFNNSAGNLHSL